MRERDDEDLAGRLLEDVVDRGGKEAGLPAPAGRRPEDDQVGSLLGRLLDNRLPDRTGPDRAALHEDAVIGAEESIAEAKLLGADYGVTVDGRTVRARAIGQAIVQEAAEQGADLIVLGSSPRWRRQSRFFSPTVDYVLKKAPSEVLIVAFPQGVLEGDGDGHTG